MDSAAGALVMARREFAGSWEYLLENAIYTAPPYPKFAGAALIGVYEELKARQQALDFDDLEWHAWRLLGHEDHAAYVQARLDARYRHLLVDEFQDTNPLQWQVLERWLAAYGADDAPSVFVVGDPKQSIYAFRRAEPRLFDAANRLVKEKLGGTHLRTYVTRRNAPAVV
jgi:ATP-dependent helicase/nuclease subunit A